MFGEPWEMLCGADRRSLVGNLETFPREADAMTTPQTNYIRANQVLLLAFELSNSRWKLGFGNGEQRRFREIAARDLLALEGELKRAREKFGMGPDVPVVSCYEAGRDGFWLHRSLLKLGVQSVVIDPASIEMPRRRRARKTDKLDVRRLLQALFQYVICGNKEAFSVCRVPDESAEDDRRVSRELDRLRKEVTSHRNRIKGLLATIGLTSTVGKRGFVEWVQAAQTPGGEPIRPRLRAEILRQYERVQLAWAHVLVLEQQRREAVRDGIEQYGDVVPHKLQGRARRVQMVSLLMQWRAIGERGSWTLVDEFLGWRNFTRGKQVGAAAGLIPGVWQSGDSDPEQSISKVGNGRVRRLMVQLAWGWLRFQPDSNLSHWYQEKFGDGGSRRRRVGIVALARKLLIALWRFVEHGQLLEGAVFKPGSRATA